MKAVKWNKYGPPSVLEVGKVAVPEYKNNEILVEVEMATVTAGDCELRSLKFPFLFRWALRLYLGILKPRNRILGQEMVGRVIGIGSDVTKYQVGDRILAALGITMGAYGEYLVIKEKPGMGSHTLLPASIASEEAVCLPVGGLEAMHFMANAKIKAGDKVLINGAGGSIGTLAIQLAKGEGAYVIAVDRHDKLDLLRELGADEVIDYEKNNFYELSGNYHVIFDIVGKAPIEEAYESLSPLGVLMVGNPSSHHKRFAKKMRGYDRKVICTTSPQHEEDLIELVRMLEQGELKVAIDQIMALDDIVKAHEYVEAGNKRGNLVIKVKNDTSHDEMIDE